MDGAWDKKHLNTYSKADWINFQSIFADTVLGYLPKSGAMLELGAGQGQDSRFFATHGYQVVSTDMEPVALELNEKKLPSTLKALVTIQRLDLQHSFPFADAAFDIAYAHLSLHYFTQADTTQIFSEIERVLRPGGTLALLVNSVSDPEYGTGKQLEDDYFHTDDADKRFFSVESLTPYVSMFHTKLLDNEGETYKDKAKGVHNLIRYIGTKPE